MISRKINIDEQKLHIENINNNGFTIIRGYFLNKTVKSSVHNFINNYKDLIYL